MATRFVPPIKTEGKKNKPPVPWIIKNIDFSGYEKRVETLVGSAVVGFSYQSEKASLCNSNPHIINLYQGVQSKKITGLAVRKFLEKEGAIPLKTGGEYVTKFENGLTKKASL